MKIRDKINNFKANNFTLICINGVEIAIPFLMTESQYKVIVNALEKAIFNNDDESVYLDDMHHFTLHNY